MSILNEIKEYIGNKIKFNSTSFQNLYNYGVELFTRQEYETAIEKFELALKQEDVQPQVYYNLALSYQNMKDYDRAQLNYKKFLEFCENDFDGLYNLALVCFLKEDYQNAVVLFEKCVEIKPDEDAIKSLTMSYLNNNQKEKAMEFAKKALQMPENGVDLYYSIAKTFENRNYLNKDFTYVDIAIEMYSNLLELGQKYLDSLLSVSICYAKKGDWENSVEYCKKALEADARSYEANNQMGLVYYCCDEVKKSIEYYEKAIELKPNGDYKIYSNLGYAYEKIAQYDKAVKVFSKLISMFPKFPAKDEIKNHLRILKEL